MLDLHSEIQSKTARRLIKIVESYPDSETFAQNVIAHQIAELKHGILNLQLDLQEYEDSYQLTAEVFYDQITEGKLDDREEFMKRLGRIAICFGEGLTTAVNFSTNPVWRLWIYMDSLRNESAEHHVIFLSSVKSDSYAFVGDHFKPCAGR